MAVARGRVVATFFAVTTLAAVVVNKFVVQPLLWRIEPVGLAFGIGVLTFVLAAGGPLLVYWWVLRPPRRRPGTFEVSGDGPAFVVPESAWVRGAVAMLLMMQAGIALPAERVPNTDRIRLTTMTEIVAVAVPLAVVVAVLALVVVWLPPSSLTLTADGVTVRTPRRSRVVPWAELLPGGPSPAGRWFMVLLDRHGRHVNVWTYALDVDRVFLASVVRHYVEHPEDRGAIGTRQERERLESAFAAWRSGPVAAVQPA